MGAIHSIKIPTGPTGKRGPPQKVDPFFRNFSGWTEPIHWVLDRNFRKFWLNGSRPIRPNIPVWNSVYSMRRMEQHFPVHWTNQSQIIRFQVSRENTRSNGGLFYLCLLALGLFDDSEVEINASCIRWGREYHFYRKNLKGVRDYIYGTFLFSWRVQGSLSNWMTSKLFTRAVMLTFHVRQLCIFALLTKACEANSLQ